MLQPLLGCQKKGIFKSVSRASLGEFVLRFVVRLAYSGSFGLSFCFVFPLFCCFVPSSCLFSLLILF